MRVSALLPLACSMVAFILGMLCLFAGHKPGFMEDYHIVSLNTSTLGHAAFDIPSFSSSGESTTTTTGESSTPTSVGSWLKGNFKNATDKVSDKIEEELNEALGDVADKLAAELGIHQWYSLHLMNLCEGTYTPNATEKGAKKNVTGCSNQTAMYHFDITQHLEEQLHVGKYNVSLEDINWPDTIQNSISALNVAMDATFVLYAIGIAAAGLAIITSVVAFFLHGSRLISFGNWGLAVLSFVAFLVPSIVVTIAQRKFTSIINKYGNDIGVYAYKGGKYLTITWVAAAVMFLASVAWAIEFCVGRKNEKRVYTEKRTGGFMSRRSRRKEEAALRRSGV